jgi:hypothetical protein
MLGTYHCLRVGLIAIGAALPILVPLVSHGLHDDPTWYGSISAHYYAEPAARYVTARDVFVVGLLAIAACLWFYKGFSTRENVALNLAGCFVMGVAIIPTNEPGTARDAAGYVHLACAVLFFACIAYVSIWRAHDTVDLLPAARRAGYGRLYVATGALMIALPLAAVALHALGMVSAVTYWVEFAGVWAFAAYWLVKSFEMRETHAEKEALDGDLARDVVVVGSGGGTAAGIAPPAADGQPQTLGPAAPTLPSRSARSAERVVRARQAAEPRSHAARRPSSRGEDDARDAGGSVA